MERNDITALHTLSVAELQKKLEETVKQLAQARLEKKVNKLKDTRLVSKLADDIARIKTVLHLQNQKTKGLAV